MLTEVTEIKNDLKPSPVVVRRPLAARTARIILVILGIALGQAVLYGPSLIGAKVLLPLDLLAEAGVYLPRTADRAGMVPHDVILSDLVLFYEPERQFAHSELSAGRFPLWTPHRYAGAPCFRLSFSPAWLLAYAIASPVVLAWTQMTIALIAGLGAYAFFRRAMGLGFGAAAIASWCYPLTGSFVIWQGFWQPAVMCWLPWLLLAVDSAVRRPRGWGGPGVAIVTAAALLSGAADNAGQALLASGIYAVWCLIDHYGFRRITRPMAIAMGMTALGWGVGVLASMSLLMPMVEYVNTGARAAARSQGQEERPPVGLAALPQVVLPDIYGSTHRGSFRIVPGNVQESSVGAYAGLLATLLIAPLAWCSRRHRSFNVVFVVLALVALSWQLNVPGMVSLLRLPGLNMMSHNRFVFVAAFAVLALAAVGLDALFRQSVPRHWLLAVPACLLLVTGTWCADRAIALPEPVATQMRRTIAAGQAYPTVRSMADVEAVQKSFYRTAIASALLSLIGLAVLARLCASSPPGVWLAMGVGALMVFELLWFGYGRSAQCDPSLYYSRIPLLEQIARGAPGRVAAFNAFPANLAQTHGLYDIRGYDGVDPAALMSLLKPTAAPGSTVLPYAITQWLTPVVNVPATGGCRLSPVLDLLGVRYVVMRGPVPAGVRPDLQSEDYWALQNPAAMPRAFVPRRIDLVRDPQERIRRMHAAEFDPKQVALAEEPLDLPESCDGTATIAEERPTYVRLSLNVRTTAALAVLADRWDTGWNAYLDGQATSLHRVNHVLRGVVAPAGTHTVEFRYAPRSLRWGVAISIVAALGWMSWVGLTIRATRGHARPDPLTPATAAVEAASPSTQKSSRIGRRRRNARPGRSH